MAGAGERDATVRTQTLRCESCGAPWEMRGFANTRTVACESCGSIFDCSGEQWQLIQKVHKAHQLRPRFALGTRGRLDGIEWEVIGWQERSVTSWGERFGWEEHLLFNPYEGFRYLMFSTGHFAMVSPLPGVPATGSNQASYQDTTYKHFSTADAVVDEVLGEFPWEVRRGDVSTVSDYVDPPFILSADESRGEINWSAGRYLKREDVIQAFGRPARHLGPQDGVYPCQPNPHQALKSWMTRALAIGAAAWLVLCLAYWGTRQNEPIVSRKRIPITQEEYDQAPDSAAVDMPVEIKDSSLPFTGDSLEITVNCPNLRGWIVIEVVLINQVTKATSHASVELDSSEKLASVVVRGVPDGKYLLQIRPYVTRKKKAPFKGDATSIVTIKRDVPLWRYPVFTFFLLFVVPGIVFLQARAFEKSRWKESDHPY